MAVKLRMVCHTCGSEDVLSDAYAEWSFEKQEWQLQNTFDKGAYCNACDGESRIDTIEEEVPDDQRPKADDESGSTSS